jgi:hypothetical protein
MLINVYSIIQLFILYIINFSGALLNIRGTNYTIL